jgi:hypothetical protein
MNGIAGACRRVQPNPTTRPTYASAAGVQAVILPKDKSAGITPVVRKVACGAAETLPEQGRGRGVVRLLRLAQVVGRRHPAHGRREWVYTCLDSESV